MSWFRRGSSEQIRTRCVCLLNLRANLLDDDDGKRKGNRLQIHVHIYREPGHEAPHAAFVCENVSV